MCAITDHPPGWGGGGRGGGERAPLIVRHRGCRRKGWGCVGDGGHSLGYPAVLIDGALVLDDKDEVKARQDGALQVYVLLGGLQVIIPAQMEKSWRRWYDWILYYTQVTNGKLGKGVYIGDCWLCL